MPCDQNLLGGHPSRAGIGDKGKSESAVITSHGGLGDSPATKIAAEWSTVVSQKSEQDGSEYRRPDMRSIDVGVVRELQPAHRSSEGGLFDRNSVGLDRML